MPGDLIVVKGAGWSPLTYYFRRHRVSMINRPASCDGMSVVYRLKGAPGKKPASGERRVLAISSSVERPDAVLAGACLAWQPSTTPRLVFESGWLKIHEGYVGPIPGLEEQRKTSDKAEANSGKGY